MVKCLPTIWETWVQSLGQEDLLEKEMATNSNIPAWKVPWTEEPVGYSRQGCSDTTATSLSLSPLPNKDVHILIPGIRVNVTLHSKRNSEDIIKLKTLRWEDHPGGWPNILKSVL